MRILINASNLKQGGAIQVAHSFLNEIKQDRNHYYFVVLSANLFSQINLNEFSNNFKFYKYNIKINIISSYWGYNRFLNKLEKKINPDRVFSIFAPTYWKPKAKHIAGFAKPQYIYKESPFFNNLPFFQKLKLKFKEKIHMHNIKKFTTELITESNDVTNRLKLVLPKKKIHTVTNYFNQVFYTPEYWDRKFNLPRFKGITLLTISANYPHKNLNIIPDVIKYLIKNYPDFSFRFIVTLTENELTRLSEKIRKKIIFLGPVTINQCPYLYEQADFLFLPTLLECFSASYPEAMYMKRPILTSNLSFAKSLCDNAAVYFNPLSPKDIGDKIIELTYNKNKQEILIKNGILRLAQFDTSKERAKKYLKIIENALNETNHPRP